LVRAYPSAGSDVGSNVGGRGVLVSLGRAGRELVQAIAALAARPGSVLVCGETGTGKTLVARELHRRSPVAGRAQRVINCAALPEALLADILWQLGEDGAGAQAAADEAGTVLLDEVGELSPWAQAVLLRKVQPGGTGGGARFLAATHRDLDAMANAGTFSRELLARLSVQRLALSPLRLRRDEIGPLALHFLRLGLHAAGQSFVSVEPQFMKRLDAYDWPGNLRELDNAMLRALAVNESGTLTTSDLPDAVRNAPSVMRLPG
jgi:DNA-binding NtrC family response regulator